MGLPNELVEPTTYPVFEKMVYVKVRAKVRDR